MEPIELNFKHYIIDEGDVEKLIDIWKHFNKKDEPYPLPNGNIYLNKHHSDVTSYALLYNLIFVTFGGMPAPIDRWFRTTLQFRMDKPVASLYRQFNKKFRADREEIKLEDIPEDKPKKPRKKKD